MKYLQLSLKSEVLKGKDKEQTETHPHTNAKEIPRQLFVKLPLV